MIMLRLIFVVVGILEAGLHHVPPVMALGLSDSRQAPSRSADGPNCVAFSSDGRLGYGKSFVTELPKGLELKLRPDGDFGWQIRVGRPAGMLDYLWVVSPPFQTAPQLQIGPVYGLTARESVSLLRELRFVLTDADYDEALMIVREEAASPEKMAKIGRLGQGRLTIAIGRFGLRKTAQREPVHEALDWIEFSGEACVPR